MSKQRDATDPEAVFSGKSSEAQHFHLAGVELVACARDHQPILGQRVLDHFGTFHQLFDGACDVHALEILRRFQFRFVQIGRASCRERV